MNLHSKMKGTIGELAVAKYLIERGYSVFTEFGDLSKIDLIILVDKKPIKVQVKSCETKNGVIILETTKGGPGYSFKYTDKEVDIFAIYVRDKDKILFVNASWFLKKYSSTINIRFSDAKNNQKKGVHIFKDFVNFENAANGV